MEKTLSPEERIRRAEEIYYRRKMQLDNRNYARVNIGNGRKSLSFSKKISLQFIICIVIYSVFYIIQNNGYIFSDNVIRKTKEILTYDVNLPKLYSEIEKNINIFIEKYDNNEQKEIKDEEKENIDSNLPEEQSQEETNQENKDNTNDIENNDSEVKKEDENLTQMEQDAKDILNTSSLIIPLKGVITSRFGIRESTNPIVTKNHTGIDIAQDEGTVFIASMSGKVLEVSDKRRLRKSYKNYKW